ncbi:SDR family oxidoreductase [Flavobacteriaceae bacterium]|nr:SDR family oxidoreductase [Flavobacteriaceae bacterium]
MNYNPLSIENKVIFITGALGQIGAEISTSFLRQKAKVILADINLKKQEDLKKKFLDLNISNDNFLFTSLDITDEEDCIRSVKIAVEKYGKIDVLVNNAAIDAKFDNEGTSKVNKSRFEFYPLDALKNSVEVNLLGTIIITQVMCRQMLKQKSGNIINVASTYSIVAPNQNLYDFGEGISKFKPVDYIASKSFIPNFTRYLATFYSKEDIRCNAIVPHGIFNDHPKKFLENWAKLSPIGRMCNREELNGPFTFLASDASSYMTGSVLNVDGGWTSW